MGIALIQLETDHDRECGCWSTLSGPNIIQLVVTASRGAFTATQAGRALYDLLLMKYFGPAHDQPEQNAEGTLDRAESSAAGPVGIAVRCGGT